MKDYDPIDGADPSATEVELSAQDLLDMSPPAAASSPALAAPVSSIVIAPPRAEPCKVAEEQRVSPAPARTRSWKQYATPAAWALGFVAIVASAVVFTEAFSPSQRSHRTHAMQSSVPPRPVPAAEEAAPPLRIANPFDESEVFEVPAGTSEAEARDYVANLLLQRAAERQALLDTRSLQRR